MSYRISKKTVTNIFTDLLEKKCVNKDLAIDGIVHMINDSAMEYILDLLSRKDKVKLIQPKDYVKLEIITYHIDKKFNYDVLSEMGLLCTETNSVYGRVVGDSSWGSDYNPYYGSLKIAMFYHDDDGKLKEYEETINTVSVTRIKKEDIPYFKSLENGKNIIPPIESGDQGLEHNQEDVLQAN